MEKQKLGMIGLGRMGSNMARRLMRAGHSVLVYDQDPSPARALGEEGAIVVQSPAEMAKRLASSRAVDPSASCPSIICPSIIWMMLPSGNVTDRMVHELSKVLQAGDILIDGGNTHFKDDVRRSKALRTQGIHYVDVGTSGGVWGLERGYSLMIGGDPEVMPELDSIFQALAPGPMSVPLSVNRGPARTADNGYLHCGPSGSGHFVKMVHNGIEYGMMQSLAEGFDILRGARSTSLPEEYRYGLDLTEIAEVWRRGSVVSSWLLDLIALALGRDASLSRFQGRVEDSGEGRWTIQAALEEAIPAHVLSSALYVRFQSRDDSVFAEKLLSAMRNEFGGHVEKAA